MRCETIGSSRLCLGDCMELMAGYPDGHFDLAIVDPPYGAGGGQNLDVKMEIPNWLRKKRSRFGGRFDKYRINHAIGGRFEKYGNGPKHWDVAPEPEYFQELFRVSKWQIIWGGNYFDLPPSRNFIVWRKLTISENFSMAMAEYAWTNIGGNAKVFDCRPQGAKRFHPTQKPVALYEWLLLRYAKRGYKIIDTHLGSGSLAVACNMHGFDLTASEIDEGYYERACAYARKHAAAKSFLV